MVYRDNFKLFGIHVVELHIIVSWSIDSLCESQVRGLVLSNLFVHYAFGPIKGIHLRVASLRWVFIYPLLCYLLINYVWWIIWWLMICIISWLNVLFLQYTWFILMGRSRIISSRLYVDHVLKSYSLLYFFMHSQRHGTRNSPFHKISQNGTFS